MAAETLPRHPRIGSEPKPQLQMGIRRTMLDRAGDGEDGRSAHQRDRGLPVLHLLQLAAILSIPSIQGGGYAVDVLTAFEFENLIGGQIEPSPDGQIDLIDKTENDSPGVAVPGRPENIQCCLAPFWLAGWASGRFRKPSTRARCGLRRV
jgi:hypothetical protein